jgi:ribose transport system substrate-binding protein
MKKLEFLISLITEESDFQRAQAVAAERAALQHGVSLKIVYADNDPIAQIQQLLDAIQSRSAKPDAVILHPAGGSSLYQVARAAAAAGVSWAILDPAVEYLNELRENCAAPMFAVSADQLEIGRIQARQIAELLSQGGSVIYVQGPSTSPSAQQRAAGLKEKKPANIQLKPLRGATWTEASGERAVSSWLSLSISAEIDAVVAQSDFLAQGARRAFEQGAISAARQKWLSVPFLGVDGLPNTGQQWVQRGVLAATVISPTTADTAVQMLVHSLQTASQPAPLTFVSPMSYPELGKLTRAASHVPARTGSGAQAFHP